MTPRSLIRTALPSLLAAACLALTGCGGGSSSADGTSTGTMSMAVTDGPSDAYQHVWITISGIALHTDADATWSASDATWVTVPFPKAMTIDLASLNNGALSSLFSKVALAPGKYRQIRLFLRPPESSLSSSAGAIMDNEATPKALQWNDQVEYHAGTTVMESPLQIPYPSQGIKLDGHFTVTAGANLNLAVDFDLDKSVVAFTSGTQLGFILRPNIVYYDLDHAGAISGTVSTTDSSNPLCSMSAGIPTSTTGCAYNLVVKAELTDATGIRHYVARQTVVNPATGKFTLFPVALTDASGNPLSYDVVVRGRQMETVMVTGVSPAAATVSSGTTLETSGTVIPAIDPTVNTSEYSANFTATTKLAPFTAGLVVFQETLPGYGGGLPYEVRTTLTDPYTGTLFAAEPLENADVHVAAYDSTALSFSTVTPGEGTGGYLVGTLSMPGFFDFSDQASNPTVTPGVTGFIPPSPTLSASNSFGAISSGTITLNLNVANASTYDTGYFVLEHDGAVVTTEDIGASLGSNATVSVPQITLVGVPSGDATTTQPDARYYGYVVLWNSAHPFLTAKFLPITQRIDLSSSTTASVTVGGASPLDPGSQP